jgi:ABC-type transport system substrate-binding protein
MTVVVSMKGPWVPFPTYLTGQAGVVVEPRNLLGGSAQHSPVGTGPFKFQDWVPGSQFVATRNSQYWRSGFPYLDQLEFRPITDPQSLENSLKSGSIDMLSTADTQTLANLHGDSAFVTIDDLHSMVGEPDMAFLMCNTAVAPVDDIRVRQALAYALDKQKLIDILGNGILPQSFGPFVSGSPYYGPTGYPGFDLGKARALIADYEREKGKVSFELGTLASPRTLQISQVVQAMWKQAGADCRIGTLENSQFILNALNGKYQVNTWLQFAAPDPDANYIWWSSTTAGPVGQLSLNFARNKDPLIQQALDTGRMTPDPAVRAAAYKTVARRFGEDLPYLWVARGLSLVSARRGVMNFAGPTLPDGGTALALLNGVIWPTQIWRQT